MARGNYCEVHKHGTQLVPQERHHVWPIGYHGPDTAANKILICANAHSDIHYFMDHMLRHKGVWPDDWRTYSPKIRAFAIRGYNETLDGLAKEVEHLTA